MRKIFCGGLLDASWHLSFDIGCGDLGEVHIFKIGLDAFESSRLCFSLYADLGSSCDEALRNNVVLLPVCLKLRLLDPLAETPSRHIFDRIGRVAFVKDASSVDDSHVGAQLSYVIDNVS